MLSFRLSLFIFSLGTTILVFVLFQDVTDTLIRVQQAFPGRPSRPSRPPRPPYPPFHPPTLDEATASHPDPDLPGSSATADHRLWNSRAVSVKEAFLRAYHSYERYAPFPADELLPVSNQSVKQ